MKPKPQSVKDAFFAEVQSGTSVKAAAAHAGVHYITGLNWMKKKGMRRRGGKVTRGRVIAPVAPPKDGKADTDSLMRFAAMVEGMERRGQVSGIFIAEEFQLVIQAKLGIQELLLTR